VDGGRVGEKGREKRRSLNQHGELPENGKGALSWLNRRTLDKQETSFKKYMSNRAGNPETKKRTATRGEESIRSKGRALRHDLLDEQKKTYGKEPGGRTKGEGPLWEVSWTNHQAHWKKGGGQKKIYRGITLKRGEADS